MRPCHNIAAAYLGVHAIDLPPGLAWQLKCVDDRLRKMGSGLQSRQAIAGIVEAYPMVHQLVGRDEPMPADFWR